MSEPEFLIRLNSKLFLRDPERSALGQKIVRDGLDLILKLGFEDFTFKKLAKHIGTTEASIYRYFENKHRLLTYLINWYWTLMEYRIRYSTNNLQKPEAKLKKVIELLCQVPRPSHFVDGIAEKSAYDLLMQEGSKAYLTRHVHSDNKDKFFKPYKDLCAAFSNMIREYNPAFPFSHSLASTILETAHAQRFFMQNLPSLTDFAKEKQGHALSAFLETLLFSAIKKR